MTTRREFMTALAIWQVGRQAGSLPYANVQAKRQAGSLSYVDAQVGRQAGSLSYVNAQAGRQAGSLSYPRKLALSARVQVLQSVAAVPPGIVGAYRDPVAFQQAASGQYFVLDRLAHVVYGIDRDLTGSWKIVQIGQETGRLLEPAALSVAPNGTFVVADRPGALERVQVFGSGGALLGGFTLPGRAAESVTLDGMVLNGIGSLQYSGRSVFLGQPETGALAAEYTLQGVIIRTFGVLRATGQESDRAVHQALNTGLPLVNPRGGFYFVFQAGIPMFRKLNEAGGLVFERHIEGPELDAAILGLPTTWPRRKAAGDQLIPVVRPVIRTAAVDPAGNLWVALAGMPYTYVYDSNGERTRVVQFRGAGTITPSGLFFAPDGRLLVAPGCYIFQP
jgi:hypothetical protein